MSALIGGGAAAVVGFGPQVGVPANQGSAGTPFQFAFDGVGNLYVCYAANTWAKFLNAAPFGVAQSEAEPLGMP